MTTGRNSSISTVTKSATRLAKGDVATEVTDAAAEADTKRKAGPAGEVAVVDADLEAEDTVRRRNAKRP
jgi:hypothetical protein